MIRLDERVTGEVIERFLAARGVGEDCPSCGQGVLSVSVYDPAGELGGKAYAVRVIHMMEGSNQGFGQFLRVCPLCGHLHYVRDIEVLAFLDQGGENGR